MAPPQMEQIYSFLIDTRLRIKAWDERILELIADPSIDLLDKKYYEVFPKVKIRDKDALFSALKDNKAFTLKGYCLKFCNTQMIADIKIKPVELDKKGTKGARIYINPRSRCPLASQFYSSQRLIDIGKIASFLAHGVRNPLNAIKGSVVYLREKYAGEETLVEFTKIMEEEISRLDNFISKFLSTSISDTGTIIDLNAVLKKIEMFTFLQARANRIQALYICGDIGPVVINSFQVEQAILNIINNSMEAMRGGGKLTVRSFSEDRPERRWSVIEITDTGPGISDGRVAELATGSEKKGKGFGLFITREILKYYGGHLEIKSFKDLGTKVRLYFPERKPEQKKKPVIVSEKDKLPA